MPDTTAPAAEAPVRVAQPMRKGQPTTDEYRDRRTAMVDHQIEARGVRDPQVLEAMRRVPRHWFVPPEMVSHAYEDRPLPIGEGQTISQPYIVALMTEALRLKGGAKVLEVGTGSGYQAAVLAELTERVWTIEIVAPLAERAMRALEAHGYRGIDVRIGDGYAGWPEHAPFDAIIVTCAPGHVPPALIEQLAPGGRMCIPVGSEFGVQELRVIIKQADGATATQALIPVRFVPMTGAAEERKDKPGG
jgi:protein-L-isoaspartate(D-aspartate) O-methyltransferase